MADWLALFRAARHQHLVDNKDISDNRSAAFETATSPEPGESASSVDNSESRAASREAIVTTVPIVNDPEPLRKVVQVAIKAGASFRIVGADVEIDGDLPDELRAQLAADRLWEFLGAAQQDRNAVAFLAKLGVRPDSGRGR